MIDTSGIKDLIIADKDRLQEELTKFLSIASVSTDASCHSEVERAAQFVSKTLETAGASNVCVMPTAGLPVVFGEKIISPDLPTVLVYGHYDVQPADPINLWDSPPFQPIIKNGKIYARGACDDKAQMMIPIKALEYLQKSGELAYNLKFLFEGEEEIGSKSLLPFIQSNKELLKANCALIIDTFMHDKDTPAIVYGVKGAIMFDLEITGPEMDMHSGLYGGIIKNPADELSRVLSSFKNEENKIIIEGFNENIVHPSPKDLEHLKEWCKATKGNLSDLKTMAYEPTLEINGMTSGYRGEGAKTIIPAKASAKFSIRTVPGQDSENIVDLVTSHIENKLRSEDFNMTLNSFVGCSAAVMNTEHWIFEKAEKICKKLYRNEVIYQRMGGSIPIVGFIQDELQIPSLLIGFGLESDNIHAPNEHYHLSNYYKGIETIANLLNR